MYTILASIDAEDIDFLKTIKNPSLFVLNSDPDNRGDASVLVYKKFASQAKKVLKSAIRFFKSKGGIYFWVLPRSLLPGITLIADKYDLPHTSASLPKDLLQSRDPFSQLELNLKGLRQESLKRKLTKKWETVVPPVKVEKKPEDKEPIDYKNIYNRLQGITNPILFIVNSTILSTSTSIVTEEEKLIGKASYKEFITDKDMVVDILKASVKLFKTKAGHHCWIVPRASVSDLTSRADFHGIVYTTVDLPSSLLQDADPFTQLNISLTGLNANALKRKLVEKWAKIVPEENITKEVEKVEEKKSTVKEKKVVKKSDLKTPSLTTINKSKLSALKEFYILVLDPRKRYSEYTNFLDTQDNTDTDVLDKDKASEVLPKSILFLKSSILSPEGMPILVYFIKSKDVSNLQKELRKESRPHFKLFKFYSNLLLQPSPFSDKSIEDVDLDTKLVQELNSKINSIVSESSGNPVPAIQISSSINLSFFRMLNQDVIKYYIGGKIGGTAGIVYILIDDEQRGRDFVRELRSLKMPSLFYESLTVNSDIDASFKTSEPVSLDLPYLLILYKNDGFNPTALVEIKKINKQTLEVLPPNAVDLIKKIKAVEKEVKNLKESEVLQLKKVELKKLKNDFKQMKFTQITLLHAYARNVLKNSRINAGTLTTSGSVYGDLIVNFNADMKVCFMWGSFSKKVNVDVAKSLEQLPFVDKIDTSYL